jgi:hypothetical protein
LIQINDAGGGEILDALAEYLRTAFVTEREEMHNLRDTADEVLATLQRFKRNAQFPYELADGTHFASSQSSSTSAMILFAMGVATGKITSSILIPRVSLRNQDEMPPEPAEVHATVVAEFQTDLV